MDRPGAYVDGSLTLDVDSLPTGLLARFTGAGDEPMRRLLMFLTPLTSTLPITLREGR